LPYTDETLGLVCRNIEVVQHALGRRILVENVASYLRYRQSEIPEPEFLMNVARCTGCGILCDVTNIFITCENFDLSPFDYLYALAPSAVEQFHLGGYSRLLCQDKWLLFDEHGAKIDSSVWELYRHAVRLFRPNPTVIEWDTQLPQLTVLIDEARHALDVMSDGLCEFAE
jgi:uncharacterized protein (UPF0276 family)